MRSSRTAVCLLASIAMWTASCLAATAAGPQCPLTGERSMLVVHLYFGRSIRGRQPVTDAEWASFASDVLARSFPDGFTAYDGDGAWRDPSGATIRERTKIVTVAIRDSRQLSSRVRAVSDAYRKRFHQQSVGLITETVCAAF